ncbi:hypothetical protein K435DRAFT_852346 [Dendrothele bispora CBS 962.96]|uniref:Uncharacterized protein n=1 Tax=Dendrothele bispora (strain CBS 962.96) TaxID=1314807 RepID=A0A4S8MJJ2_DENBC|nr:hypothetical protein K435DRAFT_852346 [Dendrothele bispora CBS 962.96]
MCPSGQHSHRFVTCEGAEHEVHAFTLPQRDNVTSFESPCQALVPLPKGSIFVKPSQKVETPSYPTTVLAFNTADPVELLKLAFPDPSIRALLSYLFSGSILAKPLTDQHILLTRDSASQVERARFTPEAVDLITRDLCRLGQMVVVAANSLTHPTDPLRPFIPKDIPNLKWSLPDLGIVFPHLTFAFDTSPFESIIVDSKQTLHVIYNIIQFVAQRYATWILEQVRRSILKGYMSEANWGAYFGFSQDEILRSLTRKSVQRLEAEKTLAGRKRKRETVNEVNAEGSIGKSLVFHPVRSSLAQQGLLEPYDPLSPEWSIDAYAPSAELTIEEEDFGEFMIQASKRMRID